MKANNEDLAAENAVLEKLSAQERIAWACERFGEGLIVTTSFGLQSSVMLHLVLQQSDQIPVVFVDTGYLFPETYEYAQALGQKLGFKEKVYSAMTSPAYQEACYGKLWEQGKEGMTKYNFLNKKEPMDRALRELKATAWLAGLRRSQSEERKNRSFIEKQGDIIKIYPILDWDDKQTYRYIPQNNLPYHPLEGMGYDSLGDYHSTSKVSDSSSKEDSDTAGTEGSAVCMLTCLKVTILPFDFRKMILPEDKSKLQALIKRTTHLWKFLECDEKKEKIAELEEAMSAPSFWDDQEKARKVGSENNRLKQTVSKVEEFRSKVEDLEALCELCEEDEEDEEMAKEFVETLESLLLEVDDLEVASFLSEPFDARPALLSIHAGAGGTESCDWADMLMRMYVRWAERRGFDVEVQDVQPGEEAGISRCSIRIEGLNAYGYAKAERGVHRLVRISPFDSNKRRHTSFCSIGVIAEMEDDDVDIDIPDDDLRIDTYRSSGKGGQHANKTDSAVRLTHLPTNIVVQCQNERSQLKNKQTAMRVLKSRLYEKQQDEKRAEMEKFYGEKGEMGWGNQIRSYVFQPYQMVKDLRTGVETSAVQSVMDGELDSFVNGWLRAGCPRQRNKDIQVDD